MNAFTQRLDEMCKSDEEVFSEYAESERRRLNGARVVTSGPGPGEPGFTGSPGGLSDGIPGLKELPVG